MIVDKAEQIWMLGGGISFEPTPPLTRTYFQTIFFGASPVAVDAR